MRTSLLLVAVLAVATALPALAEEEEDQGPLYNRSGPFVGAGLSIFSELFDQPGRPMQPSSNGFDPAVGFHVNLGYRVNKFAAVGLNVRRGTDSQVSPFTDATILTVIPGLRFYPLGVKNWRVQPFLNFGLGYMSADVPSTGIAEKEFAAQVGGGLETYITENIAIDMAIDYVNGGGDVRIFDHMAFDIGMLFRF